MEQSYKPLARADGLVVQRMQDETLVYDLAAHRAYCLNATAAQIWTLCDSARTVSEISRAISGRQNMDDLVWLALDQLAEFNLIDGHVQRSNDRESRRRVLKTVGLTALVALPAISSLATPKDSRASLSACICTSTAQCLQPPCKGTCGPLGICV